MNPANVQKAVYNVLSTDTDLIAALSSYWGYVPVVDDVAQVQDSENPAYFPFISFGQDLTNPLDTKTFNGGDAVMQIDVWSRVANYTQVKNVSEIVYNALHKKTLSIADAVHIATGMESVDYTIDPDGHTRRAMMLFRITYQDS